MDRTSTQSTKRAAVAFVIGALITAIGGAIVQLSVVPSSTVSDDAWSFPWSSDALVVASLVYAVAHVLVAIGVLGFGRSGVAGPSRGAHAGVKLAIVGTLTFVIGEFASIPIRDARMDDAIAGIVGGIYGVGTLLSAIGFVVAGRATLSAGLWHGWRRFTPLVTGVWTAALVVLGFTAALPGSVAVYGLCLVAMSFALYTQPAPTPAAARVELQRA